MRSYRQRERSVFVYCCLSLSLSLSHTHTHESTCTTTVMAVGFWFGCYVRNVACFCIIVVVFVCYGRLGAADGNAHCAIVVETRLFFVALHHLLLPVSVCLAVVPRLSGASHDCHLCLVEPNPDPRNQPSHVEGGLICKQSALSTKSPTVTSVGNCHHLMLASLCPPGFKDIAPHLTPGHSLSPSQSTMRLACCLRYWEDQPTCCIMRKPSLFLCCHRALICRQPPSSLMKYSPHQR